MTTIPSVIKVEQDFPIPNPRGASVRGSVTRSKIVDINERWPSNAKTEFKIIPVVQFVSDLYSHKFSGSVRTDLEVSHGLL